ncbi:MAG: hypothetical protein IJH63_11400 [Methanobrevibacter sp.]|nr:hypothetical protein [Methanobrevibacter sp.]
MIEQTIVDLSEHIDISEGFKKEDLEDFFNENKIESSLNLLIENNLLFEEEGNFYFDEEVIDQFNAQMDNLNDEEVNSDSDKQESSESDSIQEENEPLNTRSKEVLSISDISIQHETEENTIKYSKSKTLDDFADKSDKPADFESKLSMVREKSEKNVDNSRYWIHKTDFSILEDIHKLNQIGSEKPKSKYIKEIKPNDYILLIVNNRGHLDFFGLTKVDEIINIEKRDNSDFYKYYKSDIQLKLKSIRYFNNPIVGADIDNELSFVEKNKKISSYIKTDYKEIPKDDFKKIMKHGHFIKSFPAYFDSVDLNLKEFLMNSILYLYNNLKNKQKSELIEIKVFLQKLQEFVAKLGVKLDYEYLVEFYSWNAIELEFTHVPYRDPDKAIPLYDTRGKKKEYAYIDLK